MKQERMDASMRRIGRAHEWLCRIPGVGEPMSRGLSWLLAVFPMLGGMRKSGSIEQTREMLRASGEQMGFPFQISEIEGDRFVLELPLLPLRLHETRSATPLRYRHGHGPHHVPALRRRADHRGDDSRRRERCRMLVRQR